MFHFFHMKLFYYIKNSLFFKNIIHNCIIIDVKNNWPSIDYNFDFKLSHLKIAYH